MDYYASLYPAFDKKKFYQLIEEFGLDKRLKIHTLSKGMRKQYSVILGLCSMAHYLFLDETFDGLELHSGLSELPALEHSCMLHYTIGQGTRKQMYEIQKKIKKKGKKMGEQGLLVSLILVL